MGLEIDHFVWGVSDLDEGCAEIERWFGVAPEPGGAHPGLGTCNALLGLGPGLYLEVMAPNAPPPGSIGARLANLEAPGLVTWVLRSKALAALNQSMTDKALGAVPLGPVESERLTPQGDRLVWQLLFLTQHGFGGLVPFFIDWQATEHPSLSAPQAGNLLGFDMASPKADDINALLSGIGADQKVEANDGDELAARFATKAGDVTLRSTPQSLTILGG